jgi:hypothetical protein
MLKHRCKICRREFSTSHGLTQHCNAKHRGRTTLSHTHETNRQRTHHQQSRPILRPEHDENLWGTPITMSTLPILAENPVSQVDSVEMEDVISVISDDNTNLDVVSEIESRYNLRNRMQNIRSEVIEENFEENIETELQLPANLNFDFEDLQGASFDDALETIEGKNKPERIAKWPSEAYREFMELIIEGNISNKIGDKIIKFFNKHSNLKESPLPRSTKNGKDYLNQIKSPSLDFKERVVKPSDDLEFTLYYRPIFRAIQALIQRPEVADNFVHKGTLKIDSDSGERVFGEPYEGNWWLETEPTLPPLNNLLSIILYSDATTFDGLGKTSGHPVFLTLGNLPNGVRNLPESKVLLGFLPKVQDSGIKTTENFREMQRKVYHECFDIMLHPLLEKPNSLHFGIKGRVMIFAARISFFLADMLEADEVTATYKSANCRMPCHTCMVLRDDLNRMDLEPAPFRTHENMQQVIEAGQGKNYSVHPTKNAFWKFP